MATKKMFVYKLILEDGTEFNYKFENGIIFNDNDKNTQTLITSAIFIESSDEEIVVQAEEPMVSVDEEVEQTVSVDEAVEAESIEVELV